jgi:hypothetical protein
MAKRSSISVQREEKLCIYGRDLRRARYISGLSLEKVSDLMKAKGWIYYRMKLCRLENSSRFCLECGEMLALLSCVKSEFNII